jgi:predicted nucleotidyltransferase
VAHVVSCAAACPGIERVKLFGSRARGDATARSDYDFAVYATELDHAAWSRWCLDTEQSSPSLCRLDLVLASDSTSDDLRRAIEAQGVVVYDRRTHASCR